MKSTIDLSTLAEKIHAAAVEKGFWDVENQEGSFTLSRASQMENLPPKAEKTIRAGAADLEEKAFACMHAELSEAIQEDRKGMPMLYYACICSNEEKLCQKEACEHYCNGHCKLAGIDIKPEGVAVELADFVMRLLDWAAWKEQTDIRMRFAKLRRSTNLPKLVNYMHKRVAELRKYKDRPCNPGIDGMISLIHAYLTQEGYDLFALTRMKREYNKTRPRLHGRKY